MAMVKRAEHEKAIQENILSVLQDKDEIWVI
jgi:calcineurin-like phosphoesterase family protein